MTVRGCIFDLDGVIVDTAGFHYLSWKNLANELGFDFTEDQNEQMKGISRMDSLDVVLSLGGIVKSQEEKIALAARKNEWYLDLLSDLTIDQMLPGVKDMLDQLKAADMSIALGSASKNARFVINKLGIAHYFEAMVDGNDVMRSKPDPEVFLKAASLIGLKPSELVVFEDSYKGLVASNEGGFISCGVGDDKILTNALFVIETFAGLQISGLLNLIELARSNKASMT